MSTKHTANDDLPEWTHDFAERAIEEGWGVNDLHEIVRDDDQALFESDEAALNYVRERALRGSVMHATAIAIHVKTKGEK
jgi:hypothetical protein